MKQNGATISSTEMFIHELLQWAEATSLKLCLESYSTWLSTTVAEIAAFDFLL